jgi:hypothetical protein
VKKILKPFKSLLLLVWELPYIFVLAMLSIIARIGKKRCDIGLGPEPLINNVYHKLSLMKYGYSAETYVNHLYYVTQAFDVKFVYKSLLLRVALINILHIDFIRVLFSYRCLYIYFNGGSLFNSLLLWRLEPFFYQLAGIKIVVMPYGSDIQLLDKTPNLYFRHCMIADYPQHKSRYKMMRQRIHMWINGADLVVAGCDWVDYLYHWDHLMVSHFSIDIDSVSESLPRPAASPRKTLKILHAPNHKNIKGSSHVHRAVEILASEGYDVELKTISGLSNAEILSCISQADLVVDQLVIGWYAMFAIESMSLGKPTICYLRDDLLSFYRQASLLDSCEPPLINANVSTIYSILLKCVSGQIDLESYSRRGPQYVHRHHSLEAIGRQFHKLNAKIGVLPSNQLS